MVWITGQNARLTPLAERLLWAETRARTRLTPHIEALRSELERVLALAFDAAHDAITVYASHDLALPLLRDRADAEGLHIDLRFAGSSDALRALAQGRCEVAGVHVPVFGGGKAPSFAHSLKGLLKPGRHKLLACHRRTQVCRQARRARSACTRASPACGRTSSGAAARSGSPSTRA